MRLPPGASPCAGTKTEQQGCVRFPSLGALRPNATRQALEIAGATEERRLLAVACTRLILLEAPSSAYRRGMLALGKQPSEEEETS